MNRIKQAIRLALERGYTSDEKGNMFSPRGNMLKTHMRNSGGANYYFFSVNHTGRIVKVAYHKFISYQKYGETVFADGIVTRHLDGNSLNNEHSNIGYGTQSDNALDRDRTCRVNHARHASSFNRKYSNETIAEIKRMSESGQGYKKIMKAFGISSKWTLHYIIKNNYVTKETMGLI